MRGGVLEDVVAHARECHPAECCGILLGGDSDIVEAIRAGNLSGDPNRFLIDPKDHFNARRRARAAGLGLVGFYHSHPHTPPEPSPTDLGEASYVDHLYLIVSLQSEAAEARLFRLTTSGFTEVPFEQDRPSSQ